MSTLLFLLMVGEFFIGTIIGVLFSRYLQKRTPCSLSPRDTSIPSLREITRLIGSEFDAELFTVEKEWIGSAPIIFVFPEGSWDLSDDQRAALRTRICTRIERLQQRRKVEDDQFKHA